MQLENSNYSHTQARLETQLYAQEQDLSKVKKQLQQLAKSKKDAEKKLLAEVGQAKKRELYPYLTLPPKKKV